jgi:hypothetical protein
MKIPIIQGVIDRRILVNYQVNPEVLANILPSPFEAKTVNGMGIAGVCLIRLKQIRPRFVPGIVGLSSENAAHRIAVRWKKNGRYQEGVYIPRRDTSLWLNSLIGGRLFPGVHHRARFKVVERADHFRVVLDSLDGDTHLAVEAHLAADLPPASIFNSLQTASEFFEAGSLGYSDTAQPGEFDGLELRAFNWQVEPLLVENVESSFFEQPGLFPQGSVKFDCALLMRGIEHEWHGREPLCIN